MASKKKARPNWVRADLHLHTPGSIDYHDRNATYLDILRQAESRGLDIIALTDHNTVNGYAAMQREIEQLRYLKQLGRATPAELSTLADYERLLGKILVLPGFEFTATFGFHILGIFSPRKSIRELEHLLLSLNVPVAAMEEGNSEVGASSDVLTAYQMIHDAGGIVIAAHVNAAHGVAMRGMDFGGQTRIAYTQDRHLHALEVTDLGSRRRNSTERFFNGTKPEYPRRMRAVQGSDAHALNTVIDRRGKTITLGVGERATEFLLEEVSFEALKELLSSNDFARSRPYEPATAPQDYLQSAREEGNTLVQAFHDTVDRKGSKLYTLCADVCAFANTNGGTVYIGASADARQPIVGVERPAEIVDALQKQLSSLLAPPLDVEIDVLESGSQSVIRVQVPRGPHRPYALENYKIYVRDDTDTNLAVRDEIVNLVREGLASGEVPPAPARRTAAERPTRPMPRPITADATPTVPQNGTSAPTHADAPAADSTISGLVKPPLAGVEIVGSEQRNGNTTFVMRDLRNGNMVHNVTLNSARRLWHYAIKQQQSNPVNADLVQWQGSIGLWRKYRRGAEVRYDLVQRAPDGVRVYYGVSDSGMHGPWQAFLEPEEA